MTDENGRLSSRIYYLSLVFKNWAISLNLQLTKLIQMRRNEWDPTDLHHKAIGFYKVLQIKGS